MKYESERPIPENEMEVLYLFLRNHERLGFERILKIQTKLPDIIALRNGKVVRIEVEYLTSRFYQHFEIYTNVADKFAFWGLLKRHDLSDEEIREIERKEKQERCEQVMRSIDIVVCWRKDKELPKGIEVIELSKYNDLR